MIYFQSFENDYCRNIPQIFSSQSRKAAINSALPAPCTVSGKAGPRNGGPENEPEWVVGESWRCKCEPFQDEERAYQRHPVFYIGCDMWRAAMSAGWHIGIQSWRIKWTWMKHMPMKRANDDHGARANSQGYLCKNRNITSEKTIKRKFPVRCPPYRNFILIIYNLTLNLE